MEIHNFINARNLVRSLTLIILCKCVGWAPHASFYVMEEGENSQRDSQTPPLVRLQDFSLELDQMETGRRQYM